MRKSRLKLHKNSVTVSREIFTKVMAVYVNHGQTASATKTSCHKLKSYNRDRWTLYIKAAKCVEKKTVMKITMELNEHPDDLVSIKSVYLLLQKAGEQTSAAIRKLFSI